MRLTEAMIEELRAGLEGVTPGPWRLLVPDRGYCSNYVLTDAPEFAPIAGKQPWRHLIADFDDCSRGEANAAHIARCDPDSIRTLLNALASKDKALEEMRAERDDAIATVKLLQQQFKQQNDHDTALLERMADCLDCARMDWEVNNGEIINKADPHWTVEARRLCAARAQAEGETP